MTSLVYLPVRSTPTFCLCIITPICRCQGVFTVIKLSDVWRSIQLCSIAQISPAVTHIELIAWINQQPTLKQSVEIKDCNSHDIIPVPDLLLQKPVIFCCNKRL